MVCAGEDHRTGSWTMGASKLCDSCKSATASLFCKPDSAFLCIPCDTKIHAANKLASRHARVWMCEVCEQAPAHVTCKADAASLCVACDRDIHSANPLARRHERFPVTPFYDSAVVPGGGNHYLAQAENNNVGNGDGSEADEAEAASWLLPNLNFNASSKIIEANGKQGGGLDQYDVYSEMDPEMDPYLDLEFGSMDQEKHHQQNSSSGADCVVPVQNKNIQDSFVNGGGQEPCLDFDFLGPAKGYPYYSNGLCISQSVSSSDVGVVPEASAMIDVSNPYGRPYNNNLGGGEPANPPVQVSGVDREARVLRYREKRKNRKFEKTIRYASRKAYAETRPRIKGRFAKRTDIEVEVDQMYGSSPMLMPAESGYGIVPSF